MRTNRGVITDEMRDHAITMRDAGMKSAAISAILGTSKGPIDATFQIYDAVKEDNPLTDYSYRTPGIIRWACERLGKDYDTVINRKTNPQAPEKREEREDNTALAFSMLLEAVKNLTDAVNGIETRMSVMQMALAGMRDDGNQNGKKIIEAINVNGDIQTKEWQAIKDKLEAIKINTKRRPWKEENT